MLLDEDSCKYVTINTQRGIFRYTCLPFGVSSAPTLFQRTMDSILESIPNILCYIDDILITGATQEAHLKNLKKCYVGYKCMEFVWIATNANFSETQWNIWDIV